MTHTPARPLRAVLRDLPGRLTDAVDRWIMRLHQPFEIQSAEGVPAEPYAMCSCCHQPWPCPDYARSAERAGPGISP